MQSLNNGNIRQLSPEMRAVLKVVNADEELKQKMLPFINPQGETIDWPKIWSQDFSGGHSAAVCWIQALWCDKVLTKLDPFDRAFAMDEPLQRTVIEALAIRWGLIK